MCSLYCYAIIVVYFVYRAEEYIWNYDKIKTSCGKQSGTRLPLFRIDSTGPTQRTKQCVSPIEIFQLLFTTAIVEGIVQQTIKTHGSESRGQEEAACMCVFWPTRPLQ